MSDYVRTVSTSRDAFCQQGGKQPVFRQLDIELTERCNLNCIHCYINQPAADRRIQEQEMDTGLIKSILDQAAELGYLTVRFTGGEPLLRPDFPELYLHTRRLGMRVMLFTNATLLNRELVEMMAAIPPLEKIEITVYGMSARCYGAVTGKQGAYSAAMQGIDLLLKYKIPFIVKGTILPPNEPERVEFEEWAATLPWMVRTPSYVAFLDLRARRDLPEKQEQIRQLRRPPGESWDLLAPDDERFRKRMAKFTNVLLGTPGDRLFHCGAGQGGCVDAYGRIQPCLPLRHPEYSWDLRNHSLRRVLLEFFPKIREVRAKNQKYLSRCSRCFIKSLCEQCPAKSWMEYGTLDTPIPYVCEAAHAQGEKLGLLAPGEKAWQVKNWQKRQQRLTKIQTTGSTKNERKKSMAKA